MYNISRLAHLDATAFLVSRIRSFVYVRAFVYIYDVFVRARVLNMYMLERRELSLHAQENCRQIGSPVVESTWSFVSLSRSLSSSYPLKTKSALIYRGVTQG